MKSLRLLLQLSLILLIPSFALGSELISPFKRSSPVEISVDYDEHKHGLTFSAMLHGMAASEEGRIAALLETLQFSGKRTNTVELVSFWGNPNLRLATKAFAFKGFRPANVADMLELTHTVPAGTLPILTIAYESLIVSIEEATNGVPCIHLLNYEHLSPALERQAQWAFIREEKNVDEDIFRTIEVERDGSTIGEWNGLELTLYGWVPTDPETLVKTVYPRIELYLFSMEGKRLIHDYKTERFGVTSSARNKIRLIPRTEVATQ